MIADVLNRMAPRNRQALLLLEYAGLSCDEIGETVGGSRAAVKSLLFRARQEFRRVSHELGYDATFSERRTVPEETLRVRAGTHQRGALQDFSKARPLSAAVSS